jgi:hypothetical protein
MVSHNHSPSYTLLLITPHSHFPVTRVCRCNLLEEELEDGNIMLDTHTGHYPFLMRPFEIVSLKLFVDANTKLTSHQLTTPTSPRTDGWILL